MQGRYAMQQKAVVQVGDVITYGHYRQSSGSSAVATPIEWIVLDYDARKRQALLIARYGLEARQFHHSPQFPTWEKSDIRKWLNSEFPEEAFTEDEQAGIQSVTIKTPPRNGISGGKNTRDRIWLLSCEESEKYFDIDDVRKTEATEYAVSTGAWTDVAGRCWWWLRSPGDNDQGVSFVSRDGSIDSCSFVYFSIGVVRPAFVLDLSTAACYSVVDTVPMGRYVQEDLFNGSSTPEYDLETPQDPITHAQAIETIPDAKLQQTTEAHPIQPIVKPQSATENPPIQPTILQSKVTATAPKPQRPTAIPQKQATGIPNKATIITAKPKVTQTEPPLRADNVRIGGVVTYGCYRQSDDVSDGATPIEWIILKHDEKKQQVLLISKYGLEAKQFHSRGNYPTWEKSDIRAWLNGEFLNVAFTVKEREAIQPVTISTLSVKGLSSGNNTRDKVWLLSKEEAEELFDNDNARKADATQYAKSTGAFTGFEGCCWWLRSPGSRYCYAFFVNYDGAILSYGSIDDSNNAVRPALAIDLKIPAT